MLNHWVYYNLQHQNVLSLSCSFDQVNFFHHLVPLSRLHQSIWCLKSDVFSGHSHKCPNYPLQPSQSPNYPENLIKYQCNIWELACLKRIETCVLHTAELPLSSPVLTQRINQEYQNNTIFNNFTKFIEILTKINKNQIYTGLEIAII